MTMSLVYVLIIYVRFIKTGKVFYITHVYVSCDSRRKHNIWGLLGGVMANYTSVCWCLCSDFNAN